MSIRRRRPKLIAPALATIHAVDKESTPYDVDLREPVRHVRRQTYQVQAQLVFGNRRSPQFLQYGAAEQYRASLTVLRADVNAVGWTPKRGDKLVKFGLNENLDLYATQIQPLGHREDGPDLYRIYLSDRRPSTEKPSDG